MKDPSFSMEKEVFSWLDQFIIQELHQVNIIFFLL